MKERPILFSGPMVRTILAGTKIQTRRVAKNITRDPHDGRWRIGLTYSGLIYENEAHLMAEDGAVSSQYAPFRKGDRLWVRETWGHDEAFGDTLYRADHQGDEPLNGWKPSIHMLRAISRIALEITEVRIQRLQDISEEDAKAEGAPRLTRMLPNLDIEDITFRESFRDLWETINGKGSWELNPFVWILEFRRIEKTAGTGLPGLLTKEGIRAPFASR